MPLSSAAPVDPLRNGSGLWPERVIVNAGLAGRAAARATLERTARLADLVTEAVDVVPAESTLGEVSAEAFGASAVSTPPIPRATASAPR